MKNVNSVILIQGRTEETPISIGGMGESTTDRTLQVVIKSVPRYGILFADQDMLEKDSVIQMRQGESYVFVSYKSTDELFFSLPQSHSSNATQYAADEFEFTVEAIHPVTGESMNFLGNDTLLTIQRIEVLNVNHRPSLIFPENSVTLTIPTLGSSFVLVDGIYVNDIDNNVNRVRVDVWSDNGELTLNDKYRNLADFESCSGRWELDWRCRGDGVSDRNMTFLTEPSHVSFILAELEYTALFQGNEDKVTVQVFDGVGGNCISEDEQTFSVGPNGVRYSSVQDGCYGVIASVKVLLSPKQAGNSGDMETGSGTGAFFSVTSVFGWLFYGLLIFGFFLAIWCCFRCFFGRKRGSTVNYE